MLFPHADTVLDAGDVVTVVTEPHQASLVRAIAEGARRDAWEPEERSALQREVGQPEADRQAGA